MGKVWVQGQGVLAQPKGALHDGPADGDSRTGLLFFMPISFWHEKYFTYIFWYVVEKNMPKVIRAKKKKAYIKTLLEQTSLEKVAGSRKFPVLRLENKSNKRFSPPNLFVDGCLSHKNVCGCG